MIEMRVDMIVVACCLIRYLLEQHTFNRVRVSTYALKEGVLASIIQEIKITVKEGVILKKIPLIAIPYTGVFFSPFP